MLGQLAICDVVLIDRLELMFEPGLGVLTGETGAGKSILLDSLGLALGARSDSGLVRAGQDAASVSAELMLPPGHPVLALLDEQGITLDPGEALVLRRTVRADGGSRAFAGGVGVSAATLRDIGALSIEIHGQHDDRGLLNPRGHRALLDTFGKMSTAGVAAAWGEVSDAERRLDEARRGIEDARRDRDYLSFAADEIGALAPQPGEETELSDQRATMQAGARAGESLTGIDALLGGSDGALAQLRGAARKIERGAADHPLLAEALASLDRAVIEAAEAEDRIARAADTMAFDPARLEAAEARLFDIRAMARKHRVEPDALAALGEVMRSKLAAIDAGEGEVKALEAAVEEARGAYLLASERLHGQRVEAALRLDLAVAEELAPL